MVVKLYKVSCDFISFRIGDKFMPGVAVPFQDAVERFKQYRDVDLIILDSVMPKKNGREVYEEIRLIDPGIKAIFTSGYTKDVVLNKGIGVGEVNFIAKPFLINMLLQKIREVLDR